MLHHLVRLWGLYFVLMSMIAITELDKLVATIWYQLEGGQWQLKHFWLTQTWLHDGGHDLAVILFIAVLLSYGMSVGNRYFSRYRHALAYLSISIPVSTLMVSAIKRLTQVDCPWSVVEFGGERPYQFWLHSVWSPLQGADHCFPAGHASSAYMFFGLYFVSTQLFPQHAKKVLYGVISFGVIFGIAQQLRGAHYISHDITSAFICWTVSCLLWKFWPVKELKPGHFDQ